MKIIYKIWLKNGNIITEKLKVPKGTEKQSIEITDSILSNIGADNKTIQVGYTAVKNNEIVAMQAKSI